MIVELWNSIKCIQLSQCVTISFYSCGVAVSSRLDITSIALKKSHADKQPSLTRSGQLTLPADRGQGSQTSKTPEVLIKSSGDSSLLEAPTATLRKSCLRETSWWYSSLWVTLAPLSDPGNSWFQHKGLGQSLPWSVTVLSTWRDQMFLPLPHEKLCGVHTMCPKKSIV